MPLDFNSLQKLLNHAEMIGFRPIGEEETMAEYRKEYAKHREQDTKYPDPVEAHEIRTGKGWDKWTDAEFDDFLVCYPATARHNPMVISRLARRKVG